MVRGHLNCCEVTWHQIDFILKGPYTVRQYEQSGVHCVLYSWLPRVWQQYDCSRPSSWRLGVGPVSRRTDWQREMTSLIQSLQLLLLLPLSAPTTCSLDRRKRSADTGDVDTATRTHRYLRLVACLTPWRPLLPCGYSYKASCDTPG